jgi:hypothetical protein
MVKFGELIVILELHRQRLTVSAIARQLGLDRKRVCRYIERGLAPPTYGPRPPRFVRMHCRLSGPKCRAVMARTARPRLFPLTISSQ